MSPSIATDKLMDWQYFTCGIMDVEALILKGESQVLEFKESLSLKDEIGEGISALSNTAGGMILAGVGTTGKLPGFG